MAELALDARVGHVRVQHVRQREDGDGQRRGLDHVRAEQQVGQRRGQEHQPRQPVEEVQHGVEVAQPLRQRQARA
jgi:hypothetical protein